MSLEGTIVNGQIELDEPSGLPDGTRVRVLVAPVGLPATALESTSKPLAERLLALAGRAKGLPSDMARNHDHYVHGTRKR